ASVIASQAVIAGAFSITRQAIQLGYIPRLKIVYTSDAIGQVYLPFVNWVMFVAVVILVLGFQNSSNIASAYGIAVTATMIIDTILMMVVARLIWKWRLGTVILVMGSFVIVDAIFVATNATKFTDGGWFPLTIGGVLFM